MTSAFLILATFGAVWGLFGDYWSGLPHAMLALPILISAALLVWAWPAARTAGPDAVPNMRRVVALWSSIEVVLIILAVKLLNDAGAKQAIPPAIGLIVGAHFLPLAHGLRTRDYWFTGAALMAVSAASLALPVPARMIVMGWGGAAILWATMMSLRRKLRMQTASRS